jgi:hypothetical protein
MKKKLLIAVLIVLTLPLSSFIYKSKNDEAPYKFLCEIISKKDSTLLVKTSLINTGNKPLVYYTMTCDTFRIYTVESKTWALPDNICQYNTSIKDSIPAHHILTKIIKLIKSKNGWKGGSLRIGFKVFDSSIHTLANKPDDIIWSEYLIKQK